MTDPDEGIPMTLKAILKTCERHNLYQVPELNDVLYLNSQGFSHIANLDLFVNVKALWLNNNALFEIDHLDSLVNLSCLYLQENAIETMSGLDNLVSLETMILSHNYIEKIENLSGCTSLTTLELDYNQLRDSISLEGLKECPTLQVLNISHNSLEGADVLDVLASLRQLRVLRLEGNPLVRKIPNYRRQVINLFPELKFLDDSPVTERDRRLAAAWKAGGKAAENEMRHTINDETEQKMRAGLRDFRRMQRDAMLERGGKIADHPELLSSDDEDAARLMQDKFARQVDEEDEMPVN
jgi:dynein assembly factor 1